MPDDIGVQKKSDDSPLTKADLASNAVIVALENLSPRFLSFLRKIKQILRRKETLEHGMDC